ncbi:MAG: aldehyde ferredoxin oxidoreductase N-terminal domain-containing protein, partial [Halarsenatibacteraceae bacterium]
MGYTAWINLNNGEIKKEETPVNVFKDFLGSRGYAAKLLYDNVGTEVEPFSPENLLIYSPGLLTGTPWPTGARYNVTAKSPLTGSYGYANASGFFGPELRQAGFDALVIKGKSERPVYLLVEDDKISIQPAEDYWGKKTSEVEKTFKEKYKGSKVSCIGPA